MAIEYINTGQIANDGTGDALREAFIKINNNFEELDLRLIEETVIENVGSVGVGLYAGKTDGVHGFKKVVSGTNINITEGATTVTLDVPDSLDELLIVSDNGSLTVANGQSMTINGGNAITTSVSGQTLTVDLDSTNIVSRDNSPTLSANLNANNNNILNINTLYANTYIGSVEGNVWGYDLRDFGEYFSGFDFGNFRTEYTSAIQFIVQNIDVDFGDIDPERLDLEVDLGYIS